MKIDRRLWVLCLHFACCMNSDAADVKVPDGFTVERVAGAPLVDHPTFATFDDSGRLFVCENAGVNLSAEELEQQLPNSIRMLEDTDGDGHFDKSSLFADKMTFPMGSAWHAGALYVASPPNIWRLADTDGDGVADQRDVLVGKFGYTGNAASIHGPVLAPDGRLVWCDGYHGHELRDADGNITSQREGSYIFSCWPDGRDIRMHCGGGMDNPVEVDFTTAGDMLGTVNILYTRPRVDALVHWLHGGTYPHREKVLAEVKTTGDILGPVHAFGHVAVSGTMRYRSADSDQPWHDNFFATFFNSGKVVRVELAPSGSTFEATQREFLSCSSHDFHPTDIVEDADGSLLVVDTGGWFYRGCPTSQFAKPDVLGGIYRIRRDDMQSPLDPRGLQIKWGTLSPDELVPFLDDTRFAVRERAIAECAARGEECIVLLNAVVQFSTNRMKQNALWALTRCAGFTPALAEKVYPAIRSGLEDADPSVRQIACQALASLTPLPSQGRHGNLTDQARTTHARLLTMLEDSTPPVRRAAATALGVMGNSAAVPELLSALAHPLDRSEEHAIIYALIEINDQQSTRHGLASTSSAVRRGALIALDQMPSGELREADIVAAIQSSDPEDHATVAKILTRHPEWSQHAVQILPTLLANENQQLAAARELLEVSIQSASVASWMGEQLSDPRTSSVIRQMLLAVIRENAAGEPHASWIEPVGQLLQSHDPLQLNVVLPVIAAWKTDRFDQRLTELSQAESQPLMIRVAVLQALSKQPGKIPDAAFDLLLAALRTTGTDSQDALTTLGASQLSSSQLLQLAPLLSTLTAARLSPLLGVYQRSNDSQIAEAFLTAMERSKEIASLSPVQLSEVIKRYPPVLLPRANAILLTMREHEQTRLDKLDSLTALLRHGSAERGQQLFASDKAKCASCHRVGPAGSSIGPDLSTIGANRAQRDLLESIVLPSATIVRDYEPITVLTSDGRVLNGTLARETAETLYLQPATGEPMAIARDEIEELSPSSVSIMPNGLDEALTPSELADVVAYLATLRGQ